MDDCKRCEEALVEGETDYCAECQRIVNTPTEQAADMFYEKCFACYGNREVETEEGWKDCPFCGGEGYLPAGIRKAQVDKVIKDRDRLLVDNGLMRSALECVVDYAQHPDSRRVNAADMDTWHKLAGAGMQALNALENTVANKPAPCAVTITTGTTDKDGGADDRD